MNRYGLKIMTALLLMGGMLAGCIRDEAGMPCGKSEGVYLVISVAGMSNKQLTRADYSERTDRSRIEDMNIVLADASGVIQEIIYVPNPTAGTSDPGMEDNGLINGNLPVDNGTLLYHVGSTSWAGKSKIFVVCNYWQINRGNDDPDDDNINDVGTIIPGSGDLNNCLKVGIATIDDLKALQQGTPFKPGIMTSTLFGEAKPATGTDDHGGQNYTCELKRTTAMITVAIETGGDTKKINTGVKITPRSICLHNVPVNCNIGSDNSVNTPDRIWGEGLVQQVGWDPLVESNEKVTVGGHGNDPNIVPVFMFENLQGKMNQGNTNEVQKEPNPKDKEKYCSYIEVIADYLYVPQGSASNQKYISGPIKYRLYLGENITNDFNVHRNKHYQVTLSLKGMGGLVEDGKTDEQGNFIAEGADASWRVDSEKVTGGGSFLTDGTNMPSNGAMAYIGFVGEKGHEYAVYCKEGVDGAPWLWAQTPSGMFTPSESFPATLFSYDQCGGEPGVTYILLFAQPWIDEYGSWKQWSQGDITSITNWINNGYRVAHLLLKDKTTGDIVNEFEARQWLPMPVMVDDTGNPITGDPNNASFYYSRIDLYEGVEMVWGPDFYNNNWDVSNLKSKSMTYRTSYWGSSRDFNPNYGFDILAALYGTNPSAFNFRADFGKPEDAVGAALFRSFNAVTSTGGSIVYEYSSENGMARIGLPTVKEWEKIMQYGVVDVRFGISNVPYWTSSMEGTQTYTYNPIIGAQNLENRTNKHRVRLVYHKNDFATKN